MGIDTISQRWFLLLLAIVFAVMLVTGLRTGSAVLIYTRFRRSDNPMMYWASIVVSAFVCVVLLVLAFFPNFLD